MSRTFVVLIACILSAPVAVAHAFNHADRHEVCGIYGDPLAHAVGDGHAHWHHHVAVGAHDHDGVSFDAAHTHADVAHDPCNQVGMKAPMFSDAGPLDALAVEDAVMARDPDATLLVVRGEGVELPVKKLHTQTSLVVHGDQALAAMGFPGSGTEADPYVVEGYLIRNVMDFKDTSKCIVIRNNVIHSDAILGEIIDPDKVIDREAIEARLRAEVVRLEALVAQRAADVAAAQEEVEAAAAAFEAAVSAHEDAEAARAPWDEQAADYARERAQKVDALTGATNARDAAEQAVVVMQQVADAHREAHAEAVEAADAAGVTWEAAVAAHEEAAADFESFVDEYGEPEPPAREYRDEAGAAGAEAVSAFLAVYEEFVEDSVPEDGDFREAYSTFKAAVEDAADDVEAAKIALAAAGAAAEEARSDLEAALAKVSVAALAAEAAGAAVAEAADALATLDGVIDAFSEEYAVVKEAEAEADAARKLAEAALAAARADLRFAEAQLNDAKLDLASASADHQAILKKLEDGAIEYLGKEYDSLRALADAVLQPLIDELDETLAGRLILDWNGQCVHAYNNIVEDLRVNRNNMRTGFATGGLLEDNRIHTIGQIRHYDGEFRENEVGNRDHLLSLLPDSGVTAPAGDRAINNDGANQGWFHHNTIYGSVDLDFHGHHHGAGFFAPESHYHGSAATVAYMYNSQGQCAVPGHMHGDPNLVDETLEDLGLRENQMGCLPHHDHTKRWTSVFFEDNVVIDPLRHGVRFEDQNHEGDDRDANSEDLEELNMPHFHETAISIARNTIVGSVFLDIVNADGVEVWSDDYSEVERDPVTDEIIDALQHLGAQRIPSHPERNNAWVDVVGNAIYVVGGGDAILMRDAKDIDRGSITDNRAFVLAASPTGDADAFVSLLVAGHTADADDHVDALDPDGTAGAGTQTGIRFVDVADSALKVCGNTFRGFDRGMVATDRVYASVTLTTCPTNDWGDADPAVSVAFTAIPQPRSHLTDDLEDLTDDTLLGPVLDPVYDEVDDVEDGLPDLDPLGL